MVAAALRFQSVMADRGVIGRQLHELQTFVDLECALVVDVGVDHAGVETPALDC